MRALQIFTTLSLSTLIFSACGQAPVFDRERCAQSFATVEAKISEVHLGVTSYADLKETILAGAPITLDREVSTDMVSDKDALGTVYWEPGNRESWCGTYLFRVGRSTSIVSSFEKFENYLQGV